MANSLASSADEVLGASTLPQDPLFFAPIELSGGLYASQRLRLMDKYESAEMGMAKRNEALHESLFNTEKLIEDREALSIQSETVSKLSEILEPLSPTYSEDRVMFLDMAGRSPAVANALKAADARHIRYNNVLDDHAKAVAAGSLGRFYREGAAEAKVLGALDLLRNNGDASFSDIRISTLRHAMQAGQLKHEHNERQATGSLTRAAETEAREFSKRVASAPIDWGFDGDDAKKLDGLIRGNDWPGVFNTVADDYIGKAAKPALPDDKGLDVTPVKLPDTAQLREDLSLGKDQFVAKYGYKLKLGQSGLDIITEYAGGWDGYLEGLFDKLNAVNDLRKRSSSFSASQRHRGTTGSQVPTTSAPYITPRGSDLGKIVDLLNAGSKSTPPTDD